MQEDPDIPEFPQRTTIIEEELDYVEPSPFASGLQTGHRRQPFPNNSPALIRMASSGVLQRPLDEDHLTDTSSSAVATASRTAPPSYRPMASVSGSVRRPIDRADAQDLPSGTAEELDFNPGETTANASRAKPPQSYRPMASVWGSARRK